MPLALCQVKAKRQLKNNRGMWCGGVVQTVELEERKREGARKGGKLTGFAPNWCITTALWLRFPMDRVLCMCEHCGGDGLWEPTGSRAPSPSFKKETCWEVSLGVEGSPQALFYFHFQSVVVIPFLFFISLHALRFTLQHLRGVFKTLRCLCLVA